MPDRKQYEPRIEAVAVTIANGTALSSAVDLYGGQLVGVQMPAAWTAAALTFQGSYDGTTFGNVKGTDGTEVSWTVAAGEVIRAFHYEAFWGLRHLKVRSGTAGTPVNQTAERTLQLLVRVPAVG